MRTKLFSIVSLLFFLAACNGDSDEDTYYYTVYIDHYKQECNTNMSGLLCFRTRYSEDSNWDLSLYEIENFNYKWGYTYKVTLKMQYVSQMGDCAPVRYQVAAIEEETPVDLNTVIHAYYPGYFLEKNNNNSYSIKGEKDFICSDQLCDSLDALLEQDVFVDLVFSYQEDISDPWLLTDITCSDQETGFYESCIHNHYPSFVLTTQSCRSP
ncbi:MAG: DUF4377 domain-containing protein [Candidatus Thiodiazotropha sp.]